MFSLNGTESLSRPARPYAVNKRASTSRVSLFSNTTSQSKSSASTITQESYLKSVSERKRKGNSTRSSDTKSRSSRRSSSNMQKERPARRSRQNSASDIDVFTYLVKEIEDPTGAATSWEAERSRISKKLPLHDDADEIETKSIKSRQSDSGISLNDSGYDSTSPASYLKPRLGSLPENVFVENYGQLHPQHYEQHPELPQLPPHHMLLHYHHASSAPFQLHHAMSQSDGPRTCPETIPPLKSGYDLLASSLSLSSESSTTSTLPPLYRRFTTLTHRILLQLQDEITEMEADLSRLDAADAHYRRDIPASRRDWAPGGRLDLLGKIHVKLEQYHAAVLSVQRVRNVTVDALEEDVQAYRTWLNDRKPLQDVEMRFLDKSEDVMSLDVGLSSRSPTSYSSSMPATPSPLAQAGITRRYDFHVLISLSGIWLITCVPYMLSRWTFLLLLAAFITSTQPSTLSTTTFDVSDFLQRCKSIALPLIFWLLVTSIC